MKINLQDKRYYSIGEVASKFNVNPSLIRFWEQEFKILNPKKNSRGNRKFTHKDIEDHSHLHHEMNGDCIEMEGGAIGLVCNENNIPFVIVRTISDKADGSAAEDFSKLHHLVAGNSYSIVSQMLPKL